MVFKDKTAYAASAEIAQIEKAIEELRARPAATASDAAEVVEVAEVVESGSDSSPSNQGAKEEPATNSSDVEDPQNSAGEERVQDTEPDGTPDPAIPARPRSLETETKLVRIADLRDELEDDNLSDDARSAIEAEIDSISGELPPDIGEGQTELGL
jgi:hypothetical protein